MNCCYHEILEIMGKPLWWNEHAVPRYVSFAPKEVANIYAEEAALLLITCQSCEAPFKVCVTRTSWETQESARSLQSYVRSGDIAYGDPPHADCCPAGPTMSSTERRVLEFWTRGKSSDWLRLPELEIELDPEWAHG